MRNTIQLYFALDPWLKKKITEVVQSSYNNKLGASTNDYLSSVTSGLSSITSTTSYNATSIWGSYVTVSLCVELMKLNDLKDYLVPRANRLR